MLSNLAEKEPWSSPFIDQEHETMVVSVVQRLQCVELCEYKAGEDRWSCAGFSGQRLERKTWRNELFSWQQWHAPFPHFLTSSAARAPSRCHARPSSLGLGPRGPPLNRAAGSLQRRGPQRTEGWCLAAESPPPAWRRFQTVEAENVIHQEPSGRQSQRPGRRREATVIKLPAGPAAPHGAESCWKLGLWVKSWLLREIWQIAELMWGIEKNSEPQFNITVFLPSAANSAHAFYYS